MTEPVFLTIAQLAERWHRHRRGLLRMRDEGTGPAYVKIAGKYLYRLDVVEAYEAAQTHHPADRYASVEPQNAATRSNGRLAAHPSIVRPLTERQ